MIYAFVLYTLMKKYEELLLNIKLYIYKSFPVVYDIIYLK